MLKPVFFVLVLGALIFQSAGERQAPKMLLSDYGFFTGKIADLKPAGDVVPYDLNMPLFSDYAWKARFIKIPAGTKIGFRQNEVFEFPEGAVLIKNFFYPADFNQPDGQKKILETRLLMRETKGWKALAYVWRDDQTDAELEVAGGTKPVAWKDEKGENHRLNYSIPNVNQCKSCHSRAGKMAPIGLTAGQLNKNFSYSDGAAHQLEKWAAMHLIDSLPAKEAIAKSASFEAADLEARARAYLDINCGSCHHPEGVANTSGLFLHYQETNPTALGILKAPVAAGRGAGNRQFNIVPGKPDASILLYRMESDDPGIRMPEIGRSLPHREGISLIRKWIENL